MRKLFLFSALFVSLAVGANAQNALLSPDWIVPETAKAAVPGVLPFTRAIGPEAAAVPLKDCPYDHSHAEECRVHWRDLTISSLGFLAFENVGNVYTGYWYRWETTHGKWWDRYVNSVEGWRWNVWKDDNPFLDDYVGHPMMGAITNFIWIQNDPKSMTLEQSNTWPYWRRQLRALAFSTFYSFEWKLGPIGEASIGHGGDHLVSTNGVISNETGDVELVTTPIGGMLWSMAEDYLDLHVVKRLEDKSRNPYLLLVYQFMNPARATANIFRFRAPWYRDSRTVQVRSKWSEGDAILGSEPPPEPEAWGGAHEFGAIWGYSPTGGPVWGAKTDVRYMPIVVRYSLEIKHHEHWALRYAPELTALSMLDESGSNWGPANRFTERRRAYGAGASPEGFQVDFRPRQRVQPFLSNDGGFIYYQTRVLSPQGSQWMYTIDFGAGLNIYKKHNEALTLGFRYDHLSNADISHHNPGTDAQIIYFGVSRFRDLFR